MIIIIDSNILISACLDSKSELYNIIVTDNLNIEFITPHFALEEIKNHSNRICVKAKKSVFDFEKNLDEVLSHILLLPDEEVSDENLIRAEDLTKNIDVKDTIFIAFSLALNSLFWSGDIKLYKALKRKGFANIITTKEFKQIIKGL